MENSFKVKRLVEHRSGNYQMWPVPPGHFQNKVHPDTILGLVTNNKNYVDIEGYTLDFHTPENLLRLTPQNDLGKNKWKMLLIIKSQQDNKIVLKGALRNIETNEIALISSINKAWCDDYKKDFIKIKGSNETGPVEIIAKSTKRLISSCDDEYKICSCKMIAPLFFWEELKNRLLN
jgi:hypothetical protein